MCQCYRFFKPAILNSSSEEVEFEIISRVLRANAFVNSSLVNRPLLNPIRSGHVYIPSGEG